MEQNITEVSPQKVVTSSNDTPTLLQGEKSLASITPRITIENHNKKVESKEIVSTTAFAQEESMEADAISLDETEDEINLHYSEDDETFEDTFEDIAHLKETESKKGSTTDDKYFSDIESSDNSQVYEPKSKKELSCVKEEMAGTNVAEVLSKKSPCADEVKKDKNSEPDFELVESDEDFEESRSQEEDSVILVEDDVLNERIPIESEEQIFGTDFVEVSPEDAKKIGVVREKSSKIVEMVYDEAVVQLTSKGPSSSEANIEDNERSDSPKKSREVVRDSNDSLGLLENERLTNEPQIVQDSQEFQENTKSDDEASNVTVHLEAMELDVEVALIDVEAESYAPTQGVTEAMEAESENLSQEICKTTYIKQKLIESRKVLINDAHTSSKEYETSKETVNLELGLDVEITLPDAEAESDAPVQVITEAIEADNEEMPQEIVKSTSIEEEPLESRKLSKNEANPSSQDCKTSQETENLEAFGVGVKIVLPDADVESDVPVPEVTEAMVPESEDLSHEIGKSTSIEEKPLDSRKLPTNEANTSSQDCKKSKEPENLEAFGVGVEIVLPDADVESDVPDPEVTEAMVPESEDLSQEIGKSTSIEEKPIDTRIEAKSFSKHGKHTPEDEKFFEKNMNSTKTDENAEVPREISMTELQPLLRSFDYAIVDNDRPEQSLDSSDNSIETDNASDETKVGSAGVQEAPTKTKNDPETDEKSQEIEDVSKEGCQVMKSVDKSPETNTQAPDNEDVSKEVCQVTESVEKSSNSPLPENAKDLTAAAKSVETDQQPSQSSKLQAEVEGSNVILDEKPVKSSNATVEPMMTEEETSKNSEEPQDSAPKADLLSLKAIEEAKKPKEPPMESVEHLETTETLPENSKNQVGAKSHSNESDKTSESPSVMKQNAEDSLEIEKPIGEQKVAEEKVNIADGKNEPPVKSPDESTKSGEMPINSDQPESSSIAAKESLEKLPNAEKPKENAAASSSLNNETTDSKTEKATNIEKNVSAEKRSHELNPIDSVDIKDSNPDGKVQIKAPEVIEIDDDDDDEIKQKDEKKDNVINNDQVDQIVLLNKQPVESMTKSVPTPEAADSNEQKKLSPSAVNEYPPVEKQTEKAIEVCDKPEKLIESVDIEMREGTTENKPTGENEPKTDNGQATPPDDDESLLMIDTSHKEENDPDDNDMDTETEQTATSAHTTTDSSSEGALEVFYNKECVHYECKRSSKNFYRPTLFTLNYYKISKKLTKAQYVCEECYDRSLNSYEEMCKTLAKKQPLLHGATLRRQEFVEIIDSSDEDECDDVDEKFKDENVLPKDSIELLEAELEGAIRKVMHNVDIQNQLSWTKQILQQRLNTLEEDTEFVSGQLRQLQKKADNMHNSLYQCPKIKIRTLTPLDLNSGRTYNPESESTIPPLGEVLWSNICINDTYYAVKNKAIASWVPCRVIETVDGYNPHSKSLKHYKIKFLKSKYPMLKTVSAKHMAFFNPPKVRLPIGTRVIAYFDASSLSRGKEKMLIPSAFYPGIIAEPLKQSNKFRYLVFYDDGYFQYVYHKDVRLVCHASDNVWEDVHHQSREFIHNYLTQYAVNRPMVQTQKGQSMLVDYNGKWIYARVIDVDCSLVQMLFEGQSRSEWIYRGSTRLGPVYKESNNLAQKNPSNTSRISRRTEPFIRYFNGEDSSSSQPSHEPQPQQQNQAKPGEVRSVAKKSVSRTDTSHQSSQPVPTVRHLNNSTIFVDDDNKPKGKVVYYTARKNLPPREYVSHICNQTCLFNVTHNLSYYSPLAKPLLSGWERQVLRQKSKKFIVYRGPCGKRMRSMEELHIYLRVTANELNVDNFDFFPDTNCLAEYVIESCIVQKKDISNGKEKMPIPCVNYYDNSMPPDCIYSSRRIPTEGVPLNLDENFLVGCDCEDDCSDKSKCSCWELTYAGAKYGMPNVPNEMVGYQYKRLYEHVPTGIYECNSRCKCKANCVNRVVQQPLQSKLQVFKTSNRGWGLRCINDVPRGSFICVYAGHLLTEQKANEGGLDAGDEYFAELDYIEVAEQIKEGYESDVVEPDEDEDLYNPEKEDDDDDDEFVAPSDSHRNRSFNTRSRSQRSSKSATDVEHDSQERQVISFEPNKTMGQPDTSTSEKQTIRKLFGKDEACYIMDAKVTGNLGRYFNHSCSPNLFVQNVFVDTHDLRFPWVAFFAFTHIRAGTELTWNYNYEVGVVPGKVLYCQCGAPNCRQRLL